MTKLNFIGFHATSKESANKIINDRFIINKKRNNDWLGHGIYLFEHEVDAESWAKGTYYCRNNPAIIKCCIEVEKDKFLNLDDPQKMNVYIEYFQEALELLSENNISLEFKDEKQAMCWGLNLYKEDKLMDVIKYTFPNTRTKNVMKYNYDNMSYNYNEVQICVTSNKSIMNKELWCKEG
ncbi:hypothetical protein KQH90_12225 [Anaerosalibacter bizertensis]|uniref:hypothetical protein n=1 Tax=Anaerosalibacter bizertensis TaxID=932217 RepID=UPI001C0EB9E3|nr:hypothetical protein [Anaerosalibacter bizertensis]MBU5294772.1 hypothetical protein [Anaerosalibacter bizertensis]